MDNNEYLLNIYNDTHKRKPLTYLILTLIFSLVFIIFIIFMIMNVYANNIKIQVYFLGKNTTYNSENKTVEVQIGNISFRDYDNIELAVMTINNNTHKSYTTSSKLVDIKKNSSTAISFPIDQKNLYNCEIKVIMKTGEDDYITFSETNAYNKQKIVVAVIIIGCCVSFILFALFFVLYIVKLKR